MSPTGMRVGWGLALIGITAGAVIAAITRVDAAWAIRVLVVIAALASIAALAVFLWPRVRAVFFFLDRRFYGSGEQQAVIDSTPQAREVGLSICPKIEEVPRWSEGLSMEESIIAESSKNMFAVLQIFNEGPDVLDDLQGLVTYYDHAGVDSTMRNAAWWDGSRPHHHPRTSIRVGETKRLLVGALYGTFRHEVWHSIDQRTLGASDIFPAKEEQEFEQGCKVLVHLTAKNIDRKIWFYLEVRSGRDCRFRQIAPPKA